MLESVVLHGHAKRAQVSGYKVGGKTGTAQIADTNGKYQEGIYNHSFAGVFPLDDPKIAMIVRVDKPQGEKYAETTAVPIFGEIAKWLVNYYEILPK